MSILFISDVHLSIKKPEITNSFFNFLNHRAIHAQALYILGDLFDIWLGDHNYNAFHLHIASALKSLKKKSVACYFVHGNRDFLLGKHYANLCGMTLLPMQKILQLPSGKKIVVLHGDVLCANDISYLRFKKFMLYIKTKKFFLLLPMFLRSCIANIIHVCCMQHNKYKKDKIFDINLKTIVKILKTYQAETMIHGHMHQSAIYKISYSKKNVFNRIVLGNWEKNGSVIEINEKNNNITLIEFSLKKYK